MNRIIGILSLGLLMLTACEDLIQGPEDEIKKNGSGSMKATFLSIQNELFTPTCAVSGCHAGSQNPNLTAGQAYNNLVNRPSIHNPILMRVKPGDSENSYLLKKLTGQGTSIMPPAGQLSQAIIDSITLWIDNGALNN